jgi:hypothetical protein
MQEPAPMQRKGCLQQREDSLLNCKKFPVVREFPAGVSDFAAIRCISGAESREINELVLIFFGSARVRAREGQQWWHSKAAGHQKGGSAWKSGLASFPPTVTAG